MSSMEDKQTCVRLIRAVKARPCLYDYTLGQFSEKYVTDQAWEEVAQETGMNAYKCKEKWKNMKIVLKRHLRKGVIKRRRKYYLYDYLRFVIPFMKVNDPQTYVSRPVSDIVQNTTDEDPLLAEPQIQTAETSTKCSSPTISFEIQNNSSLIDHTYNNETVVQNKNRNMSEEHCEMQETEMELISSRKKQEEEAKKSFLMSLLPDLYLMNGQQTRFFKKCVLETVEQILDGHNQNILENSNYSPM
ncbi:uncharacterized protein LOC123307321 [Coccinella septempunctata]|uniref:uncharacterized protein LOC123307321 n=1 Tax=Coccinella septempunctata TaxID=41139 RepID=UPI001D09514B|nr:uncharacterized protein LOC123307321 [Coccinella septempunctata]